MKMVMNKKMKKKLLLPRKIVMKKKMLEAIKLVVKRVLKMKDINLKMIRETAPQSLMNQIMSLRRNDDALYLNMAID